jgi:hypothetical protein
MIQHRLAHGQAVLAQLPGFADELGGVGEHRHRDRSVVARHAAEFTTRHQHSTERFGRIDEWH